MVVWSLSPNNRHFQARRSAQKAGGPNLDESAKIATRAARDIMSRIMAASPTLLVE